MGWGPWDTGPGPLPLGELEQSWASFPPQGSLCFPHRTPQVRLERVRQAESLEQVRSIMDEAPLRDIRDIKDT